MTLHLWSRLVQVTTTLDGPGPVELFAAAPLGGGEPVLVVEAYDGDVVVAAGELAVWDLNQALAALMSDTSQARRLALRDDGRGTPGWVDLVRSEAGVDVHATSGDGTRRATYAATVDGLAADLNAVLHQFLMLRGRQTIVLPDVRQESARAALMRPAP